MGDALLKQDVGFKLLGIEAGMQVKRAAERRLRRQQLESGAAVVAQDELNHARVRNGR
jgi:hypothetical protein